MEATVRGCRLVRTAMIIALDYRLHRFAMDARRSSSLWSQVPPLPFASSILFTNDEDDDDDDDDKAATAMDRRERIRALEGRIMRLEDDLERH